MVSLRRRDCFSKADSAGTMHRKGCWSQMQQQQYVGPGFAPQRPFHEKCRAQALHLKSAKGLPTRLTAIDCATGNVTVSMLQLHRSESEKRSWTIRWMMWKHLALCPNASTWEPAPLVLLALVLSQTTSVSSFAGAALSQSRMSVLPSQRRSRA